MVFKFLPNKLTATAQAIFKKCRVLKLHTTELEYIS
jgi:hypothetical protein